VRREPTESDAGLDDTAAADRPRGFPWPPIVLIGIVTVIAVVVIVARSLGGESDGPKVLTDAAFTTAASAACAEAFPALRPPSTDREDVVTAAESAAQSRKAADGLDALATRLRGLPVSSVDAPFVATWLDDWSTFVATGRQYATALDTGNVRAANAVAKGGDKAQERADRFARANGLKACQLRAAFVAPPRRSAI
jgi:hypothetical protein